MMPEDLLSSSEEEVRLAGLKTRLDGMTSTDRDGGALSQNEARKLVDLIKGGLDHKKALAKIRENSVQALPQNSK